MKFRRNKKSAKIEVRSAASHEAHCTATHDELLFVKFIPPTFPIVKFCDDFILFVFESSHP